MNQNLDVVSKQDVNLFLSIYLLLDTRCYTSHWLSLTLKWLLVSILYSFVHLHRMLFMKYFVSCRYKRLYRLYIKIFSLLQTFTPKRNSCAHLETLYDSSLLLILLSYLSHFPLYKLFLQSLFLVHIWRLSMTLQYYWYFYYISLSILLTCTIFSDVIMTDTRIEIEAIQRYYFKFALKTIKADCKKEIE